jgi:hypothetical protein
VILGNRARQQPRPIRRLNPLPLMVSDDVLYSLRYRDDTHIAHERGEHTISVVL